MNTETPTTGSAALTTGSTLYKTAEVATILRVSQRTVQEWIHTGALRALRYGKLLRIRQEDLDAFGEIVGQRPAPAEADAG
jgi:excisionase family DNA binding protein